MAAMVRNAAVLLVLLGVVVQLCRRASCGGGWPQGVAVPAAAAVDPGVAAAAPGAAAAAGPGAAATEKVVDQRGSLTVADLNVTTALLP